MKIRQIDQKKSNECIRYCKNPTHNKNKILLLVPKPTGHCLGADTIFTSAPRVFERSSSRISEKFQRCFKDISRKGKFQGFLRKVSSVFQENVKIFFAWISSQLSEQKEGLLLLYEIILCVNIDLNLYLCYCLSLAGPQLNP